VADQLPYSLAAQSEQVRESGVAKRIAFGGALDFDKLPGIGHHDIEIHIGRRVFGVIEIEQGNSADNSETSESFPVSSPVDGRVLRVMQESETVVAQAAPLLELGDPGDLEIAVDVLTTDAARIREGDKVIIERWGGPTDLLGAVRRVEPSGFTKISALGVEEQRTRVRLELLSAFERWQHFGDAYRVEVEFILAQGNDLLQVPSSALFRENGRYAVYRVVDGRARKAFVEIGLRGAAATEVRSGVRQGDVVVAHPDDRIADGVRVGGGSEARSKD